MGQFLSSYKQNTMQQKLFQDFFITKAGASGNNIEKEPQRPRPKLKKCKY